MRISIHLSFAAILLGFCVSGCKKETTATADPAEKSPVMKAPVAAAGDKSDNAIAASVDGITLSRAELMQQVQSLMEAKRVPEAQMPMAMQYFAPRMVNDFVSKTLLLGEVKRLKLSLDAAERKKYMQPLEEMAAKQGATVAELIKKAPMGEKKVLQDLDEQFLIEKLVDTQIRNKLKIEDKAVETAFVEAEKERTEKRTKIDALRAQLLAGTNFEAVAREHSDCPSGKQAGGDLGKFERQAMVKPFSEAAFTQKIGEIGPVVETDFGFHVIKVTARNEAKPASGDAPATPETVQASHVLIKAPPASTRDAIRKDLENAQIGSEMQAYLAALRGKAKVTTMFDKPAAMPGGGMSLGMPREEPEADPK
ncbi:MAG: peptidylprolyl isomerase [Kiritimatiellia bacterium]